MFTTPGPSGAGQRIRHLVLPSRPTDMAPGPSGAGQRILHLVLPEQADGYGIGIGVEHFPRLRHASLQGALCTN
jgi:hypothetical protein